MTEAAGCLSGYWSGVAGGRPSIIPVGATMCLNPGSDYSADVLRGAIVDIAGDGNFMDFLFTAG